VPFNSGRDQFTTDANPSPTAYAIPTGDAIPNKAREGPRKPPNKVEVPNSRPTPVCIPSNRRQWQSFAQGWHRRSVDQAESVPQLTLLQLC
jgi:hypothetical protein